MTRTGLFISLVLSLLLTWGFGKSSVMASTAENPDPKRILAIFLFKQGLPWAYRIEESMRIALAAKSDFPTELNVEHADLSRYPEETYIPKVVELFRYKYSKRKMDVVIAVGDESTDLLIEYGTDLFGDIPAVFITIDRQDLTKDNMKSHMTSLLWGWDFKKTINIIENSLPQSKHLFIVSGTSTSDQKLRDLARAALTDYDGRLNVEHLSGLAVESLFEKVAQLPKNSAIFYLTIFRDANGKSFVPREIMSVISEKANSPLFGIVDTYLGHGTVGGYLLSAEHQGKRYANIAVNILRDEPIKDAEFMEKGNLPMFDWQQLKRWAIDEDTLPPGSIVRYKESSFWELYRWYIIGGIFIFLLQLGFITTLLSQRRKRSQIQALLRDSEERYRVFVKNSTEGIWRVEFEVPIDVGLPEEKQFGLIVKHAYIAEANDAYARSVGFDSADKIIGTRIEEFLPLSEQKNVDTLKAWIRGQYSILNAETIESYKNGITRVFLNNTSAVIEDGRVVTVWGTQTDITELKIAEKNLRLAEQKYRTVADFTYDWEYWMASEGHMLYVSPSCERISGYSAKAFIEDPELLEEIILPEDRQIWIEHQIESGTNKVSVQEIQFRIRMRSGEIRWIENVRQPVYNPDGTFLGVRASNRDITKRKLAEEILDKSRQFNHAVLMSMKDHIAVLDWEGNILVVNESWMRFARQNDAASLDQIGSGVNYLEVCRKSSDIGDTTARSAANGIRSVLEGSREVFSLEYRCDSPTEKRWFDMAVFPFSGHKGGVIVAHSDITARKLAEEKARKRREELIRMGRITSLGELSASIAHELNQPLTGILSNAQAGEMLLKQGDRNPTEIEEILTDIVADAKRTSDVLRNLRNLFSKQKTEFEPLNVNKTIQETLLILHSEFVMQGLTIHLDLTDTLPSVMGNKVQLQQVLINLFRNASHAMQQPAKENKSITVITSRRNEIELQVQVEDTGPGIESEKLENMFDSLSTLSPDGLGMGLSISRSILQTHGGRIWAENKPSGGARISFTLPVAEKKS